jgi:hypothetical protein
MSLQEFWNYLFEIQLLDVALEELPKMHSSDIPFVLETILPFGIETDNLVKEIEEWQVINQDTMKK